MASNGVIRKIDRERGFGFIKSQSGKDIFFHSNHLHGVVFSKLQEGQSVKFEAGLSSKGIQAKIVRLSN